MKKYLIGIACLMLMGFMFSSFVPFAEDNNGVDVVVQKLDGVAIIGIDCGEGFVWYECKAGTYQLKDGILHMQTWIVQLPLDNCIVPTEEDGAYKFEIWGGTMLINPSGKLIFKEIVNSLVED